MIFPGKFQSGRSLTSMPSLIAAAKALNSFPILSALSALKYAFELFEIRIFFRTNFQSPI
jgi:hypothetical protein